MDSKEEKVKRERILQKLPLLVDRDLPSVVNILVSPSLAVRSQPFSVLHNRRHCRSLQSFDRTGIPPRIAVSLCSAWSEPGGRVLCVVSPHVNSGLFLLSMFLAASRGCSANVAMWSYVMCASC